MTSELTELINEGRVVMLGSIRQELLSGIKQEEQLSLLADHLRAFPDLALTEDDFEEAASYFNLCRAQGIQGANTDFLVCAVAIRNKIPIFTTDKDFANFAKVLEIELHQSRTGG
ncbi:MAG: PIN domain-containing protein [Kofleriaceae bacterium]|nr:PIN domain-containing protein [Kofleriaceae bacterium]